MKHMLKDPKESAKWVTQSYGLKDLSLVLYGLGVPPSLMCNSNLLTTITQQLQLVDLRSCCLNTTMKELLT